ncbi:MAG: hypothetical protein QME25_02215, partial [Bacteroidota bacterium]|nr:hypothetical protein [Bacteroidota bacterium]
FVLQPDMYIYIAVAQAQGEITDPANWKIVGIYSSDSLRIIPDQVNIEPGKFIENVNIHVDYDKLPPQPFEN